MKAISYYLALPFLYLLSLVPDSILYLFSDFVCFILYRIIGYRKHVVRTNIQNSFPEKSFSERLAIEKGFYQYLCDFFIESFRLLTDSKKSLLKRSYLSKEAQALFDDYHARNKSIIIVMGHYGNWEWGGNAFALSCKQQMHVVYHPLSNKYFDGLMYKMRTRFGIKLIKLKESSKIIPSLAKELSAIVLIADQAPKAENAYWTNFLNQDTPVYWGPERISKKLNLPVVFISIQRIKRGEYMIQSETLVENPADLKEGEITELHTKKLEKDIIQYPQTWLWSHKRWKHKRVIK